MPTHVVSCNHLSPFDFLQTSTHVTISNIVNNLRLSTTDRNEPARFPDPILNGSELPLIQPTFIPDISWDYLSNIYGRNFLNFVSFCVYSVFQYSLSTLAIDWIWRGFVNCRWWWTLIAWMFSEASLFPNSQSWVLAVSTGDDLEWRRWFYFICSAYTFCMWPFWFCDLPI